VILLPCPYCGPRNASEFRYVGEVSERPDPNEAGVDEWRTYLYARNNPAGWTTETWYHEVRTSRLPKAPPRGEQEEQATGGNVAVDGGGAIY
jgi:heterotetrameric sarcosine oxidase delta subunit